MADGHADISKHVKIYIGVLVALLVFTVLTVMAAQLHVSNLAHIAIALLIAVVKGSLVAAVFMHLKWEKSISIWWSLAICAIFFFALLLLPLLTMADMANAQPGTWG